jgi:hypothetical protein
VQTKLHQSVFIISCCHVVRSSLFFIKRLNHKVSGDGADLIVMTNLLIGKVLTGQQFVDLADPRKKMQRLNPHIRVGTWFPGFAIGSLLAVAAWVAYFGVSSLLFAFG